MTCRLAGGVSGQEQTRGAARDEHRLVESTVVTAAPEQRLAVDDVLPVGHGAAELLRLLVDAALRAPRADIDGDDPDVVLDVELDGFRCTLRRTALIAGVRVAGGLTPREQEIARMVAGGYPNKTIARVLDISAWTVGTHLRRIFLKLGVSSRAAMVARLVEEQPEFARGRSRPGGNAGECWRGGSPPEGAR